jgi:hypothetical protein
VAPLDEYTHRLQLRQLRADHFNRLHVHIGNLRLFLVVGAIAVAWFAFRWHRISPWWLTFPVALFLIVAFYHSRVLRGLSLAQTAVDFYHRGISRIDDRWTGTGQTGDAFNDPSHIYATDLDLFGRGGLFELLSLCRTPMGEEVLARWLLKPAGIAEIRQRHEAVSELRNKLDLREDIATLGETTRTGLKADALAVWAGQPPLLTHQFIRWVALLLTLLLFPAAVLWWNTGFATPVLLVLLAEFCLAFWLRKPVATIVSGTENAFENLDLIAGLLARIEREAFQSTRLQYLISELSSHHIPASKAIKRLTRIVDFIESSHNLFLRVLNVPLMYTLQLAFVAESWRTSHGAAVRGWLEAVGELEALNSFAAYSYEHPGDPFPEFVEGPATFQAEALGHPLIPAATCVCNDVSISGHVRVLLVSGSNMSGKSTLLRAVGANTVLAMAGAPVRARHLTLSPLQVGASIRINDSLQKGRSRFFSEVTRLREIFDLADNSPSLLFLLDELLQGTNSMDRRIGAEGIVRALVNRGAIGLATTHDLALTDIPAALDGRIHNVHFQDELEGGRMHFDYKLRDGIITKSNGLALMRSLGLDV